MEDCTGGCRNGGSQRSLVMKGHNGGLVTMVATQDRAGRSVETKVTKATGGHWRSRKDVGVTVDATFEGGL